MIDYRTLPDCATSAWCQENNRLPSSMEELTGWGVDAGYYDQINGWQCLGGTVTNPPAATVPSTGYKPLAIAAGIVILGILIAKRKR